MLSLPSSSEWAVPRPSIYKSLKLHSPSHCIVVEASGIPHTNSVYIYVYNCVCVCVCIYTVHTPASTYTLGPISTKIAAARYTDPESSSRRF